MMSLEVQSFAFFFDRLMLDVIAQLHDIADADLNRELDLPECNTLFVLATHLIRSADYWVLGMATGKPQPRNRQAEFSARGTRTEIVADYQRWLAEMHTVLAAFPAERLNELATGEEPLTIRDGFLHTLQHCSVHLGHIQLSRQILGYAPPTKLLPQVPNGALEPAR
ncbi:DinB family protein [Ktedonosporobacter rubrisoli]|uniref:DinB family protein n=1 Tax=Ktedonosporobacter rubrisoli TaxID=2509675 RepID=A0A4P6JNT3_KTERU|nr:DinB family protein [Ktedonosporobacter rubrisoli]QBD76780.1 DinB family protein [Ktedonosporobacter rubrisoli]